jgi:hypothetical protein
MQRNAYDLQASDNINGNAPLLLRAVRILHRGKLLAKLVKKRAELHAA